MIGYQSCVYACACVMHVLIGNNFDISISTNTRRTEGFDILVFVLVLMSRLSSLAHKHLVLVLVFVFVSLVGTGLYCLGLRFCILSKSQYFHTCPMLLT